VAIPIGRRPIDDPWATGSWLGATGRSVPATPAAAPTEERDPGGGPALIDHSNSAELRPAEPEQPGPAAVTQPPSGRLRGALDDLDRAWSLASVEPEPADPEPVAPSTTWPDAAAGCRVVIDVARDGRRFAGPRAAAVLRTVADRLHPRLPAGAYLGADDRDGLWIELPIVQNAAAASWMHQTLPGVLDDLSLDHDLARLHLRSIVADETGPVGAQLLVRLDRAPSPSGTPLAPEPTTDGSSAGAVITTCGCPTDAVIESAIPPGDAGLSRSGSPDELVTPPPTGLGPPSAGPDAEPRPPQGAVGGAPRSLTTAEASARPADDAVSGGRHHAAGRTPFRAPGQPPSNGGRRRRRAPELPPPSGRANVERAPGALHQAASGTDHQAAPGTDHRGTAGTDRQGTSGTESLGLAELLAGALAAYRGI
jgi:hypothetical protein